ncbi:hypothetical protein AVEN_239308-1 [Araneus ventricosus]|uniref:Uncharacterized protein n=1 Tax=Araneus ventricosus TaxID=182803 RepID=A0A4Y2M7V3_ARAVE|nr:hypothetical protein AVEN_239308-1 [Araneus ventricosus]
MYGHGTFHVMGGVQCVTPVSSVQTYSCIPPWIGARFCPKGSDLPYNGARPAVRDDECNEIGLKLSLDYYLSTTFDYPVQKISPTWGLPPPFHTVTPPLIPRQKIILTANIVGKFGFILIVTHDWPKNHGLNRLVMEGILSLKFRPMDAKIGTIYHWIWTAGPNNRSFDGGVLRGKRTLSDSDAETLRGIHNELINLSSSEEYFLSKVKPLLSAVSSAVKTLEESSLKAKLWLQNLKKVSVINYFRRAERSDDWNLHFYSVQRMLVHLHAAGHIHYAKSAHLYLQNKSNLKTSLSDQEFERFHSPFNQSEELISLSSGIVADDRVNCDSAEELGENAAKGIVGKRFADVTFKRKVQVFTLAAMENTKLINTDPVVFNPNQLFHRIASVLRSADDLQGCLQYEWAPYLYSLFDDVALRAGRRRL